MIQCSKYVTCVLTLLLWGCGNYYGAGDKRFDQPKEALDHTQNLLNQATTKITPLKTPLGDLIVIILPTREQGERLIRADQSRLDEVQIDYLSDVADMQWQWQAMLIERRRIFEKTHIIRAEKLDNDLVPSDAYLIWYEQLTQTKNHIHLLAPGETQTSKLETLAPVGKPDVSSLDQKLNVSARIFLDAIEKFVTTHSPPG